MISRIEFIKKAQNLKYSYPDYGRRLYLFSMQNNMIEEVFSFMDSQEVNSNDVDEFVFKQLGEPEPIIIHSNSHTKKPSSFKMVKI